MKKEDQKMNRNQQQQKQQQQKYFGLFLCGTVIDRVRRHVPKDNPKTEIVTYTLSDNDERKYYVDDYAPINYHEIGDSVSFPVYVKPYVKRNNDLSYNLCIQKKTSERGEHF